MCPGTNCADWKKSIRNEGKIPKIITKMNRINRIINDGAETSKLLVEFSTFGV